MEANINKILNNHFHQITAAFQSSLQAPSASHPPVPVPEPNPPQLLPPPSSHGAPPSRSHRTSTPIHRHRRSRSPRRSRHRSQHRRPHPHHHRTPQRHRRRSTSPPKSTSRQGVPALSARNIAAHPVQPPVVNLHVVALLSVVKPSWRRRKLATLPVSHHAVPRIQTKHRCGSLRTNIPTLPNRFRLHSLVAPWLPFHHLPLLHRTLIHPPAIVSLPLHVNLRATPMTQNENPTTTLFKSPLSNSPLAGPRTPNGHPKTPLGSPQLQNSRHRTLGTLRRHCPKKIRRI